MIIKLTSGELAELLQYANRPFGQKNFYSFMAEACARTDEGTGEIDIDRDDLERIEGFKKQGYKKRIEKVFKRPVDDPLGKFFGRSLSNRNQSRRTPP
jgi:hypothetical protein